VWYQERKGHAWCAPGRLLLSIAETNGECVNIRRLLSLYSGRTRKHLEARAIGLSRCNDFHPLSNSVAQLNSDSSPGKNMDPKPLSIA
jgi:hypothetical protein